jgi:cytochrome c-type biogenesis protein CcmE
VETEEMIKKALILMIAWVLYSQPMIFGLTDNIESSIEKIISNPIFYDGKDVVVEGEVEKIKRTASSSGNPYTLFKINDDEHNSVGVYFKGYLPITEGDKVKVMGEFKKEKRYAIFKFKNVIKAKQVEEIET